MQIKNDLLFLSPLMKAFRERLLQDTDRPGYHFCVPEGLGQPGDPNGCFYANGRYHMMYLYRHEEMGFCWGHVSSVDLLHWRHHPDCLVTGANAKGCFSGGAFVDDDGKCYLSFWDFVSNQHDFGGIRLAVSQAEPYEQWTILPDYVVKCNVAMGVGSQKDATGADCIVGVADPSNLWKQDGIYYLQTGNLLVLDQYARGDTPPEHLRGDWAELFSSRNLQQWKYEGRFYDRNLCPGTQDSEDCMCPSFLPLPTCRSGGLQSEKYLQLFISHNRGCQYYIGTYDKVAHRFIPEQHARLSVVDSAYFAPEALVDGMGRQLMWAWLRDDPENAAQNGWSGVYGMARELWYSTQDDTLRMTPAVEYEALRINPQTFSVDTQAQEAVCLPVKNGLSFELQVSALPFEHCDCISFHVRESRDKTEYTEIYFDTKDHMLVMDTTQSGNRGWCKIERIPVALAPDEPLSLRIFVDKAVVEVYANDRTAICRRVYPQQDGTGIRVLRRSAGCKLTVDLWEMAPCNPF